ncbi:MAG: DciA family protein [Bifidobacteriaceae bacterium]|nr:DciA family protein [Bifidobacteriaceae bacterium]
MSDQAAGPAAGSAAGGGAGGAGGGRLPAEKAVLARIMRGSTRLRRGGPAPKWSASRDPRLVGELVDELIEVEGWQAESKTGALLADWPRIVGHQVAAHCQVVGLEDGKLTVKADSSPWAAEIRLLSPQLRAAIDRHVAPGLVTTVEVLGPEARRARRR